jgi:hypothetical protein
MATIEWWQPLAEPSLRMKRSQVVLDMSMGAGDIVEIGPRKWDAGEAPISTTWTGEDGVI